MTEAEQKLEEQKADILARLTNSKEVNTVDPTANWQKAFDLFNANTGHRMIAGDRCTSCYQIVLDWLQNTPG